MTFHETDDIWRLYHREWVIAHTVSRTGDHDARPAFEMGRQWMMENLDGRVHEGHTRLTMNTDNAGSFWAHVEVFKDNLKGEFKDVAHAQMFASKQGFDEYTIVPRNSKSDHDIRNYGVVML